MINRNQIIQKMIDDIEETQLKFELRHKSINELKAELSKT